MSAYATSRPENAASPAPFVVQVVHDSEAHCWIATNDELPIATEAGSLEELIDRVWAIAPEIAELNRISGTLRLRFVVDTEATP
jgi:uncharacterized protein DUF1902